MARLIIEEASAAEAGFKQLSQEAARRIVAMPADQCPVEFTQSLTRLFLSESCGKCTPCRIGLAQLVQLQQEVLDGVGTTETVELIASTAQGILDSADCAIGHEAARMVLKSLRSFEGDYRSHAERDLCSAERNTYVPCQGMCPAHIDIPGYIALVNAGQYEDALRVIRNDNPLPTVCGYVCEHPCEFTCRRSLVDDAVNICGIKRYAADHASPYAPQQNLAPTGKKIAVIGGGPAGLSAAYYLQLMGHDVSVYDQRSKLGGMVRYGIPDYRLPQEKLDQDIDFILSTGVKAFTNTTIGTDLTYEDLANDFDAIYLSVGAHDENKLGCPGEDAENVLSAVRFLRAAGDGLAPDLTDKRVVVVGGGNVAMDCTRTARRLGAASVECVYRRRIADMTALPEEIEEAMAEGCQISELMAPIRIEADATGAVRALVVQPQYIGAVGADGRPKPQAANVAEVEIPCDVVIVAIGQKINTDAFAHVIATERGRILANDQGALADHNGLFAGGDAVTGPATVIRAIAAGK
ncbi:MAG: NAD(P)-binding protein, partial [Eggerthellaceae bacterium]|nr:NAD(P)-binding protein [Eggerthellaceae bacterium]